MPTDPRVMNGLHELAETAHATFGTPTEAAQQAHTFALSVIGFCARCDDQKKRTGESVIRPVQARDIDAEKRRELTEAAAAIGATITFADETVPPVDTQRAVEDVAVGEGLTLADNDADLVNDVPIVKGTKTKETP